VQGLGAGHHCSSSKESVFKEISIKGFIMNFVLQILRDLESYIWTFDREYRDLMP
jgi:hypothetical protein